MNLMPSIPPDFLVPDPPTYIIQASSERKIENPATTAIQPSNDLLLHQIKKRTPFSNSQFSSLTDHKIEIIPQASENFNKEYRFLDLIKAKTSTSPEITKRYQQLVYFYHHAGTYHQAAAVNKTEPIGFGILAAEAPYIAQLCEKAAEVTLTTVDLLKQGNNASGPLIQRYDSIIEHYQKAIDAKQECVDIVLRGKGGNRALLKLHQKIAINYEKSIEAEIKAIALQKGNSIDYDAIAKNYLLAIEMAEHIIETHKAIEMCGHEIAENCRALPLQIGTKSDDITSHSKIINLNQQLTRYEKTIQRYQKIVQDYEHAAQAKELCHDNEAKLHIHLATSRYEALKAFQENDTRSVNEWHLIANNYEQALTANVTAAKISLTSKDDPLISRWNVVSFEYQVAAYCRIEALRAREANNEPSYTSYTTQAINTETKVAQEAVALDNIQNPSSCVIM